MYNKISQLMFVSTLNICSDSIDVLIYGTGVLIRHFYKLYYRKLSQNLKVNDIKETHMLRNMKI